jgi:eukaryotic-like serine/threonine-protein kinase
MEDSATNDERIMAVVSIALRQSMAEREQYLRLACESDESLYREAVELVRRQQQLGSFLEHPLVNNQLRPFEIGQVVSNRFEIIREIGEGGMGFVYEAFDRKRNQKIAIKAAKPGFHRLLSPELQGALQVRHRNVCLVNEIHTTVTPYGEIDFLTMELLDGETLAAQIVAQGKLPADEALDVASQLCSGLAAAHDSGVLHRDFKSANIILCRGSDGLRAVITDFGLACGIGQVGEWGGTLRYMAPEVWQGKKTSKASDIYALGVVLYEMLTGRPPFDDAADCLERHPPAPGELVAGVEHRWDHAIMQCLKPVPEERPADASLVLAELRKKPVRKLPWIILALLMVAGFAIPQVRNRLREIIWPPPAVRLAILPLDESGQTIASAGMLQDVADRVGRMRSGRRTVVVIPPSQVANNHVLSPEQAKQALHATHALQTSIHRDGDAFIADGSVIDLETQAHVRDFSGRYTPETAGSLPAALAGAVSLGLRLSGSPTTESLSTAATVPYDRGLSLLRGDESTFDDAIPLFEEAARLDPRSPLPLAALAEAKIMKYQSKRDRKYLEDAQQSVRKAESLSPDSVRVRLVAGLMNQTAGQYEKALEDYRRAQELEPRNVDTLLHMASVYNALDMNNDAIATYQRAIALEPAYYLPYRRLGEYYYYRSNYAEAATQLKHAIERAPGLVEAYNELAAALTDLSRYDDAEKALLASIQLRETAGARNNLGAIRAYQKRDAEAVDLYKRALALEPQDYLYWLNLADSSRRLGHVHEAAGAYRKGMDLALIDLKADPHDGYTRAFVAYFAARLGDRVRAEDEITQARGESPSDTKVIRRAVITYEALGERDRAIDALNGAPPELIHELDRQPDLSDFRQDPRFKQTVDRYPIGGK